MATDDLSNKQVGDCLCSLVRCRKHFRPFGENLHTTAYWLPLRVRGSCRTSTPTQSKGPVTGIGQRGRFVACPIWRVAHTRHALHHFLTSERIPGHQ